MSKKQQRYAEALDELEALRDAGQISRGQYEMHRQKLTDGMRHAGTPTWLRVLTAVAIVAAALWLIALLN